MASLEHDIAELESNLRSARAERDALRNENSALRTTNELLGAEKVYLTARLEVEVRANEKAMTLLEMQSADLLMGLRAIKAANAARSRALQETSMGIGDGDASPVAPKAPFTRPQEPFNRMMRTLPEKPQAEYHGDGRPRPVARGSLKIGVTYEDRETGDVWTLQPDYSWACTWFNNVATDGQRVNVDTPADVPALAPAKDATDLNVAMGFAPEDTRVTPKPGAIDQTLADRDPRIPRNLLPGLDTDDDRQALSALAETVLRRG